VAKDVRRVRRKSSSDREETSVKDSNGHKDVRQWENNPDNIEQSEVKKELNTQVNVKRSLKDIKTDSVWCPVGDDTNKVDQTQGNDLIAESKEKEDDHCTTASS